VLVRTGWESLPGTNTLAYYEKITDQNSLITSTPGWLTPSAARAPPMNDFVEIFSLFSLAADLAIIL
jgi:hypothetical protein